MPLPTQMSAITVPVPGGPQAMQLARLPLPQPGRGEVLIRVTAAGVNAPDLAQRAGSYPPPPGASPLLGLEVSGEIAVATGAWNVGDKVVVERVVVAGDIDPNAPPAAERAFLDSLALERQPARDLSAVYGGWLARIEALAAARLSGSYEIKDESGLIDRRRRALEEHSRLAREVAQLRAQAARAKQINQRVDLNQKIKAMETAIDKTKKLMLVDGA